MAATIVAITVAASEAITAVTTMVTAFGDNHLSCRQRATSPVGEASYGWSADQPLNIVPITEWRAP